MSTTVANVRHEEYDVYIGRAGRGHPGSDWANPFRIGDVGPDGQPLTREQVLVSYRRYAEARLRQDPAWLDPLRGKVLGCWCKPRACHGDILAELADG